MTRKEFLTILDKELKILPYEEKIEVLKYYEEYFDELNLDKNDDVPNNLDPYKISREILNENNIKNLNKKNKFSIFDNIMTLGIAFPILSIIFLVFFIMIIISLLFIYPLILFIRYFMYLSIDFYESFDKVNNLEIIKYLLIFLIFILIAYPIIKFILKFIFRLFRYFIIKILNIKNVEEQYVNKIEYFEDLRKINIDLFVGKLIIKKGNENSLKYTGSYTNYEQKNGFLNICSVKRNYKINRKNYEVIEIIYTNDNLLLEIDKIVGNLDMETPKYSNISIMSMVGKVEFKIENDIFILNKNIIGKIKMDNQLFNNNSNLIVDIKNMIGKIDIKKRY